MALLQDTVSQGGAADAAARKDKMAASAGDGHAGLVSRSGDQTPSMTVTSSMRPCSAEPDTVVEPVCLKSSSFHLGIRTLQFTFTIPNRFLGAGAAHVVHEGRAEQSDGTDSEEIRLFTGNVRQAAKPPPANSLRSPAGESAFRLSDQNR